MSDKDGERTMLREMERDAKDIGKLIGRVVPDDVGFMLMIFNKGEGGFSTYVSNCDRSDMVRGVLELLDKVVADKSAEADE